MAYIPREAEVQKMVLQAMKDRAPLMYASLRKAKQLNQVATERAEQFLAEVHQAIADVTMERSRKDWGYEEGLQREEQAIRVAVEVGLANATDFPADESQDYQTE